MIQNRKKDEERMKERIGIRFFSVFLTIPIVDSTIPIPVSVNVITSPTKLPIFAILVGVTKTIKKQTIPMARDI